MKNYKNINDPQRSFVSAYLEKHSQKNQFFHAVDQIIDWHPIEEHLQKVYKKGLKDRGARAYSPLLLFKMLLISTWYDLSDIQTEYMVNDSLSSLQFCKLTIEDDVPGHSTLSRFRKELLNKNAYEELVAQVNEQLSNHGLKVKKGRAKADAKLTSL